VIYLIQPIIVIEVGLTLMVSRSGGYLSKYLILDFSFIENCKDEVSSFEVLFKYFFSSTLACLELILFSSIRQSSKSFLLSNVEQDLFFFRIFFFN